MMPPNILCSRLNEDVLQEIFVHCAEPFTVRPFKTRAGSIRQNPQLSVSRVCSSWRRVALLTPYLWNKICIHHLNETTLGIARDYLSRASSLPISIYLFGQLDTEIEQSWYFESLLAEFLSSYRFQSLTASGELANICLILLPDLPQRSVADLEQLWLDCDGPLDLNDIQYPKLATIEGGCKVSGFSSFLRVFDGWGIEMTVVECWDLLSCCPSLKKGYFVLIEDSSSQDPVSVPRRILLHRHLDTLQLMSEWGYALPFSTFIEALALPNLETLSLNHSEVDLSATAFQLFAERSHYFPNLCQFSFESLWSEVDAGPILELMPSVTSVYLVCNSCIPQTIFDHLALNGLASGSLAPRLQSLEVGYISNVGEFMNMVKSRMRNARMSSDGIPAPFTLVRFQERDLAHESDNLQWGVRIKRYK